MDSRDNLSSTWACLDSFPISKGCTLAAAIVGIVPRFIMSIFDYVHSKAAHFYCYYYCYGTIHLQPKNAVIVMIAINGVGYYCIIAPVFILAGLAMSCITDFWQGFSSSI